MKATLKEASVTPVFHNTLAPAGQVVETVTSVPAQMSSALTVTLGASLTGVIVKVTVLLFSLRQPPSA